jgi:hypothetical protein
LLSLWVLWGLLLFSVQPGRSGWLVLALALLVAAALGFASVWEWPRMLRLAVLVFFGVVLMSGGPGMRETSLHEADGRDLRRLVDDIERISSERRGDAHVLPVIVVGSAWPDPVLGWALRRMRDLRFALSAPGEGKGGGRRPLLIATEDAGAVEGSRRDPSTDHLGARYAIRGRGAGASAGREGVVLWVPR